MIYSFVQGITPAFTYSLQFDCEHFIMIYSQFFMRIKDSYSTLSPDVNSRNVIIEFYN